MKKIVGFLLVVFVGIMGTASASPVYVTGSECPSDAQMAANGEFTRQYSVTPSLRCVFDGETDPNTVVKNLQGTDAEADFYLNSAAGTAAGWGTSADADNWEGLGQEGGGENIVGLSLTTNATNDMGTFTINPLAFIGYSQFAIALKDGAVPFWAIFELSVGQYTGNWAFSSEGGDLSHAALYGRPAENVPMPEPASMVLLGSGLIGAAAKARRNKKRPVIVA